MERGLTRLGERSQESGTSGCRLDLPSAPDTSQRNKSAEPGDDEERVDSENDYQDSAENGSMDGISDHEATKNGHIDGTSDQNGSPNGVDLLETDKTGEATTDILKKTRKTKKDQEVICLLFFRQLRNFP